jgi:hypothetical protein
VVAVADAPVVATSVANGASFSPVGRRATPSARSDGTAEEIVDHVELDQTPT